MTEIQSYINRDEKKLTYKQYIRSRYYNAVILAREMVKTLGKEQAYDIIKKAFYKDMERMVKQELEETGLIENFQDFVRMEKEENDTLEFRNTVALSYPKETSTELTLHVTRCLYSDVFKELNAEDIGYLIVCNPDHAYAQTCHPRIKLRRTKTLMQGDTHCNHTWYWEQT